MFLNLKKAASNPPALPTSLCVDTTRLWQHILALLPPDNELNKRLYESPSLKNAVVTVTGS